MKRTVFWAVAGVALVATAAMAAEPPPTYQSAAAGITTEGVIYINSDPRPLTEGAVSLPTTASTGAKSGEGASTSKPGPTSFGSGDVPGRDGSAIVGPRGGALYSPQQQADREITRLIKKLG